MNIDINHVPADVRAKLQRLIAEAAGNEQRTNEIRQLVSAMKNMSPEQIRSVVSQRLVEDTGAHKLEEVYPDIDRRTGKQILNG